MDFSNLRDQVSNLTLYDIKAGVRKVQNGKSVARSLLCPFDMNGFTIVLLPSGEPHHHLHVC